MLLLKPSILMCSCDINVLPTVGRQVGNGRSLIKEIHGFP